MMNLYQKGFFSTKTQQGMPIDIFLENLSEGNIYHQPKSFINYLANHTKELLDIALNENDITESNKDNKSEIALLLLSNSPKIVVDKLLIDGRFLIKITNILGRFNNKLTYSIEKELARRISLIFTNIIIKTNDKDIIIDSVGFLTQMIRYIEDDSVLNFFRLLASSNENFNEMQNYLSQVNLYQFMINEIPNENEPNLEKERNIYIFIKDCLKNQILKNSFQREEILVKLYEMIDKRKNFILTTQMQQIDFGDDKINTINEISETLSFLVCQNLSNKLNPILSLSIEIIKTFSESIQNCMNLNLTNYAHLVVKKYHVCLLDLVSQIIALKSNMLDSNDHDVLINAVRRIIHVFTNSTNLVVASFRVVKSSLLCPNFARKMVDCLMPLFISLAKSKTRTASAAAATHFLADMDLTKNSSQMIYNFLTESKEYMAFYSASFHNYLEKAYVPYGGPVTVFKNQNIKIVRVKSPDQTSTKMEKCPESLS